MIQPKTIHEQFQHNENMRPFDLQGYNPVTEFLLDKMRDVKTILEVGTWKGYSASKWLEAAPNSKLYCIDTWLGALEFYTEPMDIRNLDLIDGYPSVYYTFACNMVHLGFADRVYPITQPSTFAWEYLQKLGMHFDFCYIDASHRYKDVLEDLTNYYPLANLVAGDDYDWDDDVRGNVQKAVNQFAAENNLTVITNGREWYLQKSE